MYPALTVLNELNNTLMPDTTSTNKDVGMPLEENSVLWIGGEGGVEADLVRRAGIPFEAIPAAGVHGVSLRRLPGNLMKLGKGTLAARKIMRSYKPDVLFFTGGYVAIPVGFAARISTARRQRPRTLLFIPDIEPGQALKVLALFADHVAITTEETRNYLPAGKPSTCTGYPVRPELKSWDRGRALQYYQFRDDLPTLLVFGGSTGARSINRALLEALPRLLQEIQILHVSGYRDWDEVRQYRDSLPPELNERYRAYPYLHEEMGGALKIADLVLSRAGAAILGEYTLFELPAILVPYPYAWRYQHTNAQYLYRRGGAVIMEDADLKEKLVPEVLSLIFNHQRLEEMKRAMRSAATPDAATEIAGILQRLSSSVERSRT